MLLNRYSTTQCTPWGALDALQQLRNNSNRAFARGSDRAWLPPVEVIEAKDRFLVTLELPGVAASSVKVSLEDDVLSVSGERKYAGNADDEVRLSERAYGRFERAIRLPTPVQSDQVTAASKDGILTITLPKTEDTKPREIKVTTD